MDQRIMMTKPFTWEQFQQDLINQFLPPSVRRDKTYEFE